MDMRDMLRKVGGKSKSAPLAPARDKSGNPIPVNPLSDRERLALLEAFESAEIGWFWATDKEGRLTYLSASAAEKFGADRSIQGTPLNALIETADEKGEEGGERPLNFFLSSHTRFHDLTVRLKGVEKGAWWSINGRPYFDDQDNFLGFRGSAKDISAQFSRQLDESRMAQYDELTGLANRHRMTKRLDSILSAFKQAKRSCALLMMDLDKFKQVNDTLGHPAGDELLRQVAQRLQRVVAAPAEIGRLGGDEFQIIIPDMDDRGDLGELSTKIIQMLSQPYSLGDDRAIIGASVGIAVAPYDGVEPEELVKSADLALYAAKEGGRGQFRFYVDDLADAARRQRQLGEDLREALANDTLELLYQPIVRSEDNKVVAFEALMRWDHPVLGSISPPVFVKIAEETNLINRLGEWVLRRACLDAAQWPGGLRVAVNISAKHFLDGTLLSAISEALEESKLHPGRLELEITEGVFLGEAKQVDRTFDKLSKIGVHLSLDDFGTGYSSLAYLRRAPFDKIKIDQSFVRDCAEECNSNAAIVTAIVSLAGALDMECTAEGVETLDELKLVIDRGATQIQGFIFSIPVAQDVVMEKLGSGDFVYEPVGPMRHRAERRKVFKRIGVIHEDHRYEAVLRNISRSGALIEGIKGVPVGTDLVLDLGGGQLAVATVRRTEEAMQGVEFEEQLVEDGAGGLCTRHRVSPYALAQAGMPLASLDAGESTPTVHVPSTKPRFLQVEVAMGTKRD